MNAEFTTVSGACGVGVVHNFSSGNAHWGEDILSQNPGGAGYLCAGFIHKNTGSNEAFKLLSEKYKLKFKTRPRININSGNKFYFCVFDTRGTDVPTGFDECDDL